MISSIEIYSLLPKDQRGTLRKIKTILVKDGFEIRLDLYTASPGVVDAWLLIQALAAANRLIGRQRERNWVIGKGIDYGRRDLPRKTWATRYARLNPGAWML